MGMFDTIRCRYPLPRPEHQDLEFQTKDLDSLLDHYLISADGRLVRQGRVIAGTADRDVTRPFHGDLRFYTSVGEPEAREWVEYVARFTHSRVEWIQPVREDEAAAADPAPGGPDPAAEAEEAPGEPARTEEERLLASLRNRAPDLDALLESCSDHWGFEDPVYRFYHQSFKVFPLQRTTEEIVRLLKELLPGCPLHPYFAELVAAGTGKAFTVDDNARWTAATRPILEAFFHARYFLEMATRYAHLTEPPNPLPSGYAALLELYGLR